MNDELKQLLDEKVSLYNRPDFIETDPIQIPKLFEQKENIEIAGFLAATIAWGQRPVIIRNAKQLMSAMDNRPHEFLLSTAERDWLPFMAFKHRTFNGDDCLFFLRALKHFYSELGGLESVFTDGYRKEHTIAGALRYFRATFLATAHLHRSEKHVPDITRGAAAKRLNMFLRWMVRRDSAGVDFGLWTKIPPSALMLPLDVHSGRQARMLGLLSRSQDDWTAVEEVTARLRLMDPNDPVKYDFALFGMGSLPS
ncbi:MAG: TIGR02757 family protein [Bacteroidales bacterium]|jgi:uncharacterized protein (TIGR02757 family)|nr:TIGR02757 family protein [Bacteroidales bacterium]